MSESGRNGGSREVAHRLFAAEYEDADFSYSESDEERAPNYVVTPTGARVNRLFVVGVLTEVEQVGENVLRARVVDPTGAFVLYAGQYQPDEQAFLERTNPPRFVAVTGKARTFQPEDSDRIYTSVRPESINQVDADTRDRWTVQAAEQTLDRVETMAAAIASGQTGDRLQAALTEAGVDESLAHGIPLALDHYGTTPTYLAGVRDLAIDAARVVAGDMTEVSGLSVDPDATGDVTAADITDELLDLPDQPHDAPADPGEAVDSAESADVGDAGGAVEGTGADDVGDVDDTIGSTTAHEGIETDEEQTQSVDSTVTETTTMDTSLDSGGASADESATGADAESGSAPKISEVQTGSSGGETDRDESDVDHSDVNDSGVNDSDVDDSGVNDTDLDDSDVDDSDLREAGDTESGGAEELDEAVDDIGDFTGDEFDLEEETREEIEEEYGTEFQSGSEVDAPGAADIQGADEGEAGTADESTATDVSTTSTDASGEGDSDSATGDAGSGSTTEETETVADTSTVGSSVDTVTAELSDDESETAEKEEDDSTDSMSTSTTSLSTMDSGGGFDDSKSDDESGGPETSPATSTTESSIGTTETDEGAPSEDADADVESSGDGDGDDIEDVQGAVLSVMAELDDGDGASRDAVVATMVDRHGLAPEEVEDAIQDALMAGECYEPGEDVLKPI